ncbi:hypothetical protein CLOHYLEM_06499 [[Clostridium] hylemonae DSM 15053]|uniref:Uncharacterized protein n=1 Tax=[Clostridium] hylemonae DSM 15053 TaxID=553973 RepID=C0C340_9FIRM|nr:hypothetical protein CLOHYLEM_06499 [[Clostridium] hylemonae DSM 15053]
MSVPRRDSVTVILCEWNRKSYSRLMVVYLYRIEYNYMKQ